MKKTILVAGVLSSLVFTAACGQNTEPEEPTSQATENGTVKEKENAVPQKMVSPAESEFLKSIEGSSIEHMHGIGYAGNQNAVFLATHGGLRIYQEGTWYQTKKENNDYMGFSATENGFYSSGHPGNDSELTNPVGLIKTSDYGETFTKLGFEGESDFHYMAAGYSHDAIYVVNQQPNSELDVGMYVTTDEGESWEQSQLGGSIPNQVGGMTTHPTKVEWVALNSPEGVFLSTDSGNTFEQYTDKVSVSAMYFSENELLYATDEGENKLLAKNLDNEEETEIGIPNLEKGDMIMFVAQNPQNEQELVIATMNNSVFITKDRGEAWEQIAKNGEI